MTQTLSLSFYHVSMQFSVYIGLGTKLNHIGKSLIYANKIQKIKRLLQEKKSRTDTA